MRTINPAGLEVIKRNEGLVLTAYRDVAGIWTIGYGHTPASPGQSIDEAEAGRLLVNDLNFASAIVTDATGEVHTTDNQFSAMVSLAFNIGIGGFRQSSVVRHHQAGDYQAAADAFLLWNKAHIDGVLVVVPGLARRRGEERALYLMDATPPVPVPVPVPGPVIVNIHSLVVMIQQALRDQGYDPGPVDGIMGPRTYAAVLACQNRRS
jgi:Phage-related lysozyme (muraminidase)